MSKKRRGRRSRSPLPAAVKKARERIEHWRATREKRTRMPEPLWSGAATAAREHGLWAVSRVLRVNYECLKRRVAEITADEAGLASGFVELDTAQLVVRPGAGGGTTVIELSSGDGAKLTVRLDGPDALDVPALAQAFWEHHR